MTEGKQSQKAGDNSNLLQAHSITIINGIDEKRAREICNETYAVAKRDLTQEAYDCAYERVQQLENRLIPKIKLIEGALNAFSDPAFQKLLTNAQRTAVATERETDYDMLSELLICHIEKGKSRKTRTGISKAVEIIDNIDDDALCALTIVNAVSMYTPAASTSKLGIKCLADLFEKLEYMDLPSGFDWIEHLDILDTVRINKFGHLKKIEEYCPKQLEGYSSAGIEIDSENYKKAADLLASINISPDYLIKNDYLPCYVKLPIPNKRAIHELSIARTISTGSQTIQIQEPISINEEKVLDTIFNLYTKDTKANQMSTASFMNEWDSHQSLKTLHNWWNDIPFSFDITHVGKVLAHTNARRCDKTLPEMPLNI